jgi:hypothetical protein
MPTIDLKIVRFEQKAGLCGAATAQMILFYKKLIGDQVSDQDALWATIQAKTIGVRPPSPPASIQATDCPTWPTQQCDRCAGAEQYICWCTYPPALLDALLAYSVPMVLSTPATNELVTAAAIASVDFDIPAAVLVRNGLHWVAMDGYETNGANAKLINGRMISEIYLRNPAVGEAAVHSASIDLWLKDYVRPVIQCGLFLNQLVVIAATAPLPVPLPLLVAPGPQHVPTRKVPPKRPRRPLHPRRPPRPPKTPPRQPVTPWKKKASKRR